MKIRVDGMSRQELIAIIEAYPKVVLASNNSPGYEIPRKKGRVHIMFCSEGIEIHRDMMVRIKNDPFTREARFKHQVMKAERSNTTQKVHKELTDIIREAASCICTPFTISEKMWCDKHGYNGHLIRLENASHS